MVKHLIFLWVHLWPCDLMGGANIWPTVPAHIRAHWPVRANSSFFFQGVFLHCTSQMILLSGRWLPPSGQRQWAVSPGSSQSPLLADSHLPSRINEAVSATLPLPAPTECFGQCGPTLQGKEQRIQVQKTCVEILSSLTVHWLSVYPQGPLFSSSLKWRSEYMHFFLLQEVGQIRWKHVHGSTL